MTSRRGPYTGELLKPIPPPPTGSGNEYQEWLDLLTDRFILLCSHYQITAPDIPKAFDSKDLWFRLAHKLAIEHVPAFRALRTRRRRGPKPKRSTQRALEARAKLFGLIDPKVRPANKLIPPKRYRVDGMKSLTAVCTWLAKNRPPELPAYYRDRPKLSVSLLEEDYRLERQYRDKLPDLAGMFAPWPLPRPSRPTNTLAYLARLLSDPDGQKKEAK